MGDQWVYLRISRPHGRDAVPTIESTYYLADRSRPVRYRLANGSPVVTLTQRSFQGQWTQPGISGKATISPFPFSENVVTA